VSAFVSGLDLGQTEDYSALAVMDKEGEAISPTPHGLSQAR
jgi:hypothetical protein